MFSFVSQGVEDSIIWEIWMSNISALWVKYPKFNKKNFLSSGLNVSNLSTLFSCLFEISDMSADKTEEAQSSQPVWNE